MRVALKQANKSPLIIDPKKKTLATRFVARAFFTLTVLHPVGAAYQNYYHDKSD